MSTCSNRIFYVFQMYIAYVSSRCCKSKSSVSYVAMTIYVCCTCMFQSFSGFKHMLQVFHLDVAYVQWIYTYVATVFFKCFSYFIWMLYILQWLYTYVLSVYSKCFTYFKLMLQVFYSGCYNMLQWLYTYVANVCFTWFQYVEAGAAPHALWLMGMHALHAPI
jgi:hypothetical protein